MYSREKFQKAIELYIKYDKSVASVIRELGYPSYKTLPRWYKRYLKEQETGIVQHTRRPKYSLEQKKTAVEHYFEHGRCVSRTVRALGYPSREQLRLWLDELAPDTRKSRVGGVKYTRKQKESAVIALCTRQGSAGEIARDFGITRTALYNWKNSLIGKEARITMPKSEDRSLPDEKEALLSEIDRLKGQIRKLKLEKDILEGALELIKKDPGIDLKTLSNREKATLVDALKNEYPLNELLGYLGMARSSYFYHRKIAALPDKHEDLRRRIIELFHENRERYGYRRIHLSLARQEWRVSQKGCASDHVGIGSGRCREKEAEIQFL